MVITSGDVVSALRRASSLPFDDTTTLFVFTGAPKSAAFSCPITEPAIDASRRQTENAPLYALELSLTRLR